MSCLIRSEIILLQSLRRYEEEQKEDKCNKDDTLNKNKKMKDNKLTPTPESGVYNEYPEKEHEIRYNCCLCIPIKPANYDLPRQFGDQLYKLGNNGLGAWRTGTASTDVILYNLTQ